MCDARHVADLVRDDAAAALPHLSRYSVRRILAEGRPVTRYAHDPHSAGRRCLAEREAHDGMGGQIVGGNPEHAERVGGFVGVQPGQDVAGVHLRGAGVRRGPRHERLRAKLQRGTHAHVQAEEGGDKSRQRREALLRQGGHGIHRLEVDGALTRRHLCGCADELVGTLPLLFVNRQPVPCLGFRQQLDGAVRREHRPDRFGRMPLPTKRGEPCGRAHVSVLPLLLEAGIEPGRIVRPYGL